MVPSGTHEYADRETQPSPDAPTSNAVTPENVKGIARRDGGREAWTFLFGAAIIEISAWAFPYSYGVFRAHYITHPPFQGQAVVSTVGVLANGMLQLVLPPIMYFLNAFPQHRKNVMWLGNLICCIAPIAGGLSTTPVALVLNLGVLYGIGAGLLFAPSIHLMNDWFSKRKSLAYGVICGAGAAAGAGLPPIYAVCLQNYGAKATLIGWGLCSLTITSAGLFCIRPRTTTVVQEKAARRDISFVRKPFFLLMLAATILQAFAHYAPSIYLPSFGQDYGLSATQASLLSTVLNLAQAVAQPLQGWLADRRSSFYIPMLISTIGAALAVLSIWGFAKTTWSLSLFSLAFGGTAGGFAVLRPRIAAATVGNDNNNEQSMLIFSILTALRGASIIACGFVSTALVHENIPVSGAYAGGGRYRDLLVYTAVLMIVASFGAVAKLVEPATLLGKRKETCGSSDAHQMA